jgi:hypothetical protein
MGYVEVQEPVLALVRFSPEGEIRPLAFVWAGRRHQVKTTTYRWRTGKGRETCRHFAVTTESEDAFQLTYREESATWWIEQVWAAE